jgi:hypothetical protein
MYTAAELSSLSSVLTLAIHVLLPAPVTVVEKATEA